MALDKKKDVARRMVRSLLLVVSNMFYYHPYLGKCSNLTNICQRGWNHQLVIRFLEEFVVFGWYDLYSLGCQRPQLQNARGLDFHSNLLGPPPKKKISTFRQLHFGWLAPDFFRFSYMCFEASRCQEGKERQNRENPEGSTWLFHKNLTQKLLWGCLKRV